MGIKPEIWGPILWGTIHMTCLAGTASADFMDCFADALPCPTCANHFKELLTELPFPETDDPLIMFQWSVNVHNRVNARIGKPVITTEQALQRWTVTPPPQMNFTIVFILLILLFLFALTKLF